MKSLPNRSLARRRQQGFSLIEILITLLILMVGLLGLVGLMVQSQRAQLESYQRVQALVVMGDMVNRISTNRKSAACYAITSNAVAGTPYAGTGVTLAPTCTTGTAEQQARAIADLQEWDGLLDSTLVSARGCVTSEDDPTTGEKIYKVVVVWQGSGRTAVPAGTACGTGLYGDDDQRRAVYVPMQVTDLSS